VDDLRFRPAWKNHRNLLALKGKVIRIRFRLRSARLYAFQVRQRHWRPEQREGG
jgi:hypothetical protein